MSFVCPLPHEKVLVRAEYLYDHKRGHGELVEGVWVSVKSICGEAFRFETYLPQYAALYDKLPISAFVWHDVLEESEQLPLDVLQIWDCMSHHVELIGKPLLSGLRAEFLSKQGQMVGGEYMWTLDNCEPDPRIPAFGVSETPDEHKSFNVLRLDNGQFALQPNNRCRFYVPSLVPAEIRKADFHVCTRTYRCENTAKWRLGDTTTVTYDDRSE